MKKTSESVMLIAFLIASIIVISFSIFEKDVFALEYNNFTSKTFGIGFQYPNDWLVDASELYITISNPNDGSIFLDTAKNPLHEQGHDLQTFTNEWLAKISSSVGDTQIIQNPTPIPTENLEMQAFLTTQQSNEAVQHWTFIGNGHEYAVRFFSPTSKFNNPENIEILDHFIKSIKIVSEGKSTAISPLRFNTADQAQQSDAQAGSFAQQGTLTSKQDPLPGHEAHQLALILPPRDDGAIYEGTLTFTSSKPTEVFILQNFVNETAVDAFYGGVATAPLGESTVAISLLIPQFGPIASASMLFAGNALALHNIDGEPFAATYTVSGSILQPQTYNEILTPPVTETTEEETADEGDDGDGDNGEGGDDDNEGQGDDE